MFTETTVSFAFVMIMLALTAAVSFIAGRTRLLGTLDVSAVRCDLDGSADLTAFFAP